MKFNFQANPRPQDVKWSISGQQHPKSKRLKFLSNHTKKNKLRDLVGGKSSRTSQNITLIAGQSTNKYNASVLESRTDINFTSELTIFNIADEDAFQYYTLVNLN